VVLGLLLRLILFMVFGLVARLLERLEEGVGAEGDQEDDHDSAENDHPTPPHLPGPPRSAWVATYWTRAGIGRA